MEDKETTSAIQSPYRRERDKQLTYDSAKIAVTAIVDFFVHGVLRIKRRQPQVDIDSQVLNRVKQSLAKEINQLEAKRLEVLKQTHFARRRIIPALIIAAILLFPFLYLLAGVFGIFVFISVHSKKIAPFEREYFSEYKSTFIPQIAKSLADFEYNEQGFIPMNKVKPSGIIPEYDKAVYQEDYFKGSCFGNQVEMVETKLIKHGRNNNSTSVFNGVMLLLTLKQKFTAHTAVQLDFGVLNLLRRPDIQGRERVHLESFEFEKKYEVFSNDQVEARKILTPAFMTRLKKMSDVYQHSNIEVSFWSNQVLLMVYYPDDFLAPPSIKLPVSELPAIPLMHAELESIINLVDIIQSNPNFD